MIDENLIAPCGMNCILCVSYQFMKGDLNQKGFHKKYCPGCNPRDCIVFLWVITVSYCEMVESDFVLSVQITPAND